MAQFLRGKQAGVQHDLSQGVTPDLFIPDDLARYGINSLLLALAYDPVQSLLAVGTSDSKFGPGQVYVYGQNQVSVTFKLVRRSSVKELHFCGDRLICRDSKNDVTVFNLETKQMIANYTPPGTITAMVSDPSLDYCLTGMTTGEVVAYDLDREAMTPFRIPNIWRQQHPRAKTLPIVAMQFHPKDIGTLLIGYSEGAVIYSFKQNKPLKFFVYEVPAGAPGGDADPANVSRSNRPQLTHAIWHPTGTFILTAHEDSSLAFWDPKDGRLVHARSIEDSDVNVPKAIAKTAGGIGETRVPYNRIAWCSKQNPDDTGLLIAGGSAQSRPTGGLTWIELGITPNYQTSSWDVLGHHFRTPKRTHILPTPPNADVAGFTLVPRQSPHYAGSHDPIAVLVTLTSGELITMSFPTGHPITPTNQLHVSLSLVHPFVTKFAVSETDRSKWIGLREYRQQGPKFLMGGAESSKAAKRSEDRNIVQTAHADGTVRVWDISHGDEVENSTVLQADVTRAVGRWDDIQITCLSMSGSTTELSVGLASGEVVVFRYNNNPQAGKSPAPDYPNEGPGRMTHILQRADPAIKQGLLPLVMTNDQQGPVTALKHSDVGFLAAGYDSGGITIIDMRGPAIIHTQLLSDLAGKQKKSLLNRRSGAPAPQQEWATVMEFGIMTLEGDAYSSIALFIGTNRGRVITMKILPSQTGRYSAQMAGFVQLSEDRVVSISPIDAASGASARASGKAMGGLQNGLLVDGVLAVTTLSSAHIFKPAESRGASKSFDNLFCDSAIVARFESRGYALVCLFGDGSCRAYSLPGLKEVGSTPLHQFIDTKRFSEARITTTGDVIGWSGPSELTLLNVWGTGRPLPDSKDLLYDPRKLPLPRPTISNLQWISGTQYITPQDMDVLIGGPDRPPSKRMLAEMRAQQDTEIERQRHAAGRPGRTPPSGTDEEGYWAYMSRQVQERTDALGLTGESMDRTADSASSFSDDVSKFVAKQKRQAALGLIGSKFGF